MTDAPHAPRTLDPPDAGTLAGFHPLVRRWFAERFAAPTAPQSAGWGEIATGRNVVIAAPTGSGKTLAAFLWALNRLVLRSAAGTLEDRIEVVYVSPLKALGNDIEKNLREPLDGIGRLASADGAPLPEIRVAVRSGDTPARDRTRMLRRPPHILITTPESLYILLTAEGSRRVLATAGTVIVDEIHAVAGDKRGAHLALSLERLDALCGRRLQRIGLSATQKPIEEIAHLLVGTPAEPGGAASCAVVDVGHRRVLDLRIEVPDQELGPITTHELWEELYDRIAAHVGRHRATLVFVNTRRQVERVAHALSTRLGDDRVAAHHGSLSRPVRLAAEQRLKSGAVPVVVATASLELGIDIGHIDLVCHVGAPRTLATLLQRVGRSGHWLGATPRGVLLPLTRDDLLQCAAAVRAVRAGGLDRTWLPAKPLDVLAQQMVAAIGAAEMAEEDLWCLVRRAWPYRELTRAEFDGVLEILCEGVADRRGRRGAYLHRDRVHGRLRARRGARLAAITSGGAIPDTGDYDVIEEAPGTFVGRVNEDFAVESQRGDIFLLGNMSWRIRRVEAGRVLVENAHGLPPSSPFWLGEAPARTRELSAAVSALRAGVAERLANPDAAARWLVEEAGCDDAGARQAVAYVAATRAALGAVPTHRTIIAERFFDESGGMQLVIHAPFGGRITRAWGFALRKRFCLTFDFELQAAATDDGLVLSLGEQHSFPLESVFHMIRRQTLEEDLVQALLASPMFANRWRWNVTRSLAILRQQGGRRVPIALQRMRAEDLLAAVFPAQVACGDNHAGPIVPPDHPLVNETIQNCLREAMDLDGLRDVLDALDRGEIQAVSVETTAPSPMSHEILNANPYAFLDDAPLEERRARAVSLRRAVPELAGELGRLDPAAIAEVCAQAWPDLRTPDELHDLLLSVGLLPVADAGAWEGMAEVLVAARRAAVATWDLDGRDVAAYVAVERLPWLRALRPDARVVPAVVTPPGVDTEVGEEAAGQRVVGGWLDCLGPVTAAGLSARLGLPQRIVDAAMLSLEHEGVVLRGRFTPGAAVEGGGEWCARRLLARIHRLTLGRLRREIEPVAPATYMRFLFRWQHLQPGTQLHGRLGLVEVISQLQGLELPATAWEEQVLPGRLRSYNPADLEHLCLSGQIAWGRLYPAGGGRPDVPSPDRRRQTVTRQAPLAFVLREDLPIFVTPLGAGDPSRGLGPVAGEVFSVLERRGASFHGDIARALRLLPSQVEVALWELVACGLVAGDGVAGLRFLLRRAPGRRRKRGEPRVGETPSGRWSLWRRDLPESPPPEKRLEVLARQYLRRYGVVFRDVLVREPQAPPWRTVLAVYRRWEAAGEIRGGRFVDGVVGEQYALPEAVEALRAVRRQPPAEETVLVSAADPLNLSGIVTAGARVPATSGHLIVYRDGLPLVSGPLGAVRSHLQPVA
ncbi:MAG TPA: DEAD/DEAH box helicase [bacterium]|nr:DEAD/DEAH box helicase [bacterium]